MVAALAVAVPKERQRPEVEKSPRELPESLPSLPRLRSEDQLDPPTAPYELLLLLPWTLLLLLLLLLLLSVLFLLLLLLVIVSVAVVASSTSFGQHSGFELNTIRLAGAAAAVPSPRGRRRAAGYCERWVNAGKSGDRLDAASGRGGVPSKVMFSQAW